jgi:hypothetical protein
MQAGSGAVGAGEVKGGRDFPHYATHQITSNANLLVNQRLKKLNVQINQKEIHCKTPIIMSQQGLGLNQQRE